MFPLADRVKSGRAQVGKLGTQARRPQQVALPGLEFALLGVLEVARLGLDEEAVGHRALGVREDAEVDAEADQGEKVHRLARTEDVAVLEDPVGPSDLVEELARVGLEEAGPRIQLVLDDRLQNPGEALEDLLLGFAEGRLVRNLEDAAAGVGALAEQAAHDHPELVDRADDLLHLVRDDEGRQVHHGRGPHSGSEVGRARREVAEVRGEGVVEGILERAVELVDRRPGLLQLKARPEHLDPEVVLLVDHDRNRLVLADDDAASLLGAAQLAADQVALNQDPLLQLAQFAHADRKAALHRRGREDGGPAGLQDLLPLSRLRPAREGLAGQVAGQADPRHEDDGRLAARGVGQLGRGVDERFDGHRFSGSAFRRRPGAPG